MIFRFLGRLVDGDDRTVEPHTVLAIAGVLVFFSLAFIDVAIHRNPFSPQGYGLGLGGLLGGAGLWGGLRPPPSSSGDPK